MYIIGSLYLYPIASKMTKYPPLLDIHSVPLSLLELLLCAVFLQLITYLFLAEQLTHRLTLLLVVDLRKAVATTVVTVL